MTTIERINRLEEENNLHLEILGGRLHVVDRDTFDEYRYEIVSNEYEHRMIEVLAYVKGLIDGWK